MISLFRRLSHRCSPILASMPVTNKVPIFTRLREELLAAKFPRGGLMMSSSSAAEEKPDFLRDVVALEELDTDLYISHSSWKALSARAMFGGQIIVQALAAGNRTVMPGLNLHSLHCYFLRPGDVSRSTVYRVNRTRDGTSFSSRSISAIQKGRPILTLQASYHNEDAEATSGILQYQPPMPVVKHHSELKNTVEYVKDFIKRPDLNEKRRARLVQSIVNDLPVEIKPLDPDAYMRQKPNDENKLTSWIRITGDLGEDKNMHRAAAAYISDWTLLWSAIASHSSFRHGMMASLDHSVWFHQPFNMNEWLLYECRGSNLTNSKGLTYGKMWKENGELALSCAQEGVIRAKL